MKFERVGRVGVVWRKTPKETKVMTLFNTMSVKIKRCKCCEQYLPVTDFYMESKSKAKFPDSTRSICINCYDESKGRYISKEKGKSRKRKYNSDILIDEFIPK